MKQRTNKGNKWADISQRKQNEKSSFSLGCHSERSCHHVHPPAMDGLVRNCSGVLIKKNKQTYSTYPNHPRGCNSFATMGPFTARRWAWDLQQGGWN